MVEIKMSFPGFCITRINKYLRDLYVELSPPPPPPPKNPKRLKKTKKPKPTFTSSAALGDLCASPLLPVGL